MPVDRVAQVRAIVEAKLAELADECFLPHCKLTFLMRNPEAEDGSMFITDDDPALVVDAIRRLTEGGEADG